MNEKLVPFSFDETLSVHEYCNSYAILKSRASLRRMEVNEANARLLLISQILEDGTGKKNLKRIGKVLAKDYGKNSETPNFKKALKKVRKTRDKD